MAENSKIEWTDATWTPIRARYEEIQSDGSGKERIGWHCEHASPGCVHCYSESFNRRLGTGRDFAPDELYREEREGYRNGEAHLFLDEKMLLAPMRWKRGRKIFVCSMTDLFADFVPDKWIDDMFAVMALCPQHTFQVLTKRSARMKQYLSARDGMGNSDICRAINRIPAALGNRHGALEMPLPNCWIGVSVEDRKRLFRIDDLRATPAAVRFLSLEPLLEFLGPINLAGIHQVISGGESGSRARPSHPQSFRDIRDQCAAADVAYFHKQNGEYWTGSYLTTTGQAIFREFHSFQHWVNKASTWVHKNSVCMDTGGNILRRGADFMAARDCDRFPVTILDRVGKKAAGALLDGVEHRAIPTERAGR